jgi:hypothetical protein
MVINSAVDDRDFDKRSKKVHHRKLFWYDFLKQVCYESAALVSSTCVNAILYLITVLSTAVFQNNRRETWCPRIPAEAPDNVEVHIYSAS